MRAIVFTLMLMNSVLAVEIKVEDRNRKYQIKYDETSIIYKDESSELSLLKKPCNAHILERMKKKLDKHLRRAFLEDSRPEFLKIKVEGNQGYEPRFGERAVFLLSMNQEIKKLKIEEDMNCNKN